jgi:hypothetical protein
MYFSKLLEHVNPNLYREYRFEKFRDSDSFVEKEVTPDKKAGEMYFTLQTNSIEKLAQKISTLDESHEAYRYLKARKLPAVWFDRLYFSDNLNEIATLFPGKYDDTKFAREPRIIIPIYNRQKELVGVAARAYKPSNLRYVMLRKSDDEPLIFNIERIDLSKPVYAFEGAFDSMFVENSVAASGIDFSKIETMVPKERMIVVVDNQPRNKEVIQRIDKTVAAGFPMLVWPSRKDLRKDINQNVIDNIIPADKVKKFIDDNVYSGMILKLKLTDWKKLEINANGNFSTSYRR